MTCLSSVQVYNMVSKGESDRLSTTSRKGNTQPLLSTIDVGQDGLYAFFLIFT
jgi:hypothetical protein